MNPLSPNKEDKKERKKWRNGWEKKEEKEEEEAMMATMTSDREKGRHTNISHLPTIPSLCLPV